MRRAIMHDMDVPMPGRYALERAAMEELRCSWVELQQCPFDLVEEAMEVRAARAKWTKRREKLEQARAKTARRRRR